MSPDVTSRRRPLVALAWIVLALTLGPIGTAAFILGFLHGESPCILCWAQRIGMVLIALTGLFILRFGPRPRYVGFALLLGAAGVYMAVRHSALHVARDIGQGFSGEILGAHTNTWSLFIFWAALIVIAVLVMALRDGELTRRDHQFTRFETIVAWVFLVAVAGNAVQAFASTGPPPYVGQSDPVRFSFNPAHWVWSLEEWASVPIGMRGRYLVPRPSLDGLDADPAHGPFEGAFPLASIGDRGRLPAVDGTITGLAYDPDRGRFVVTTAHGVALVEDSAKRTMGRVIIDPNFSVDLATFGDAALLDDRSVLALSENKSYVILRENGRADADGNYRFFLEPGPFDEVARGRFATVRAKMNFVRSVAFDSATQSLYTVSLPNPRSPQVVVSRFDRSDLTLAQENVASLSHASDLRLRAGRSLDELYVVAATMWRGRLWALSAAYSTLVAIDPDDGSVVAAYVVPPLNRPAGLAVKRNEFVIVSEDGTLVTVPLPTAAR
jgi:disulfide bond formation protein DsbB